jgi:drug/metabolite transporter (DMT)-like permease
VRRPAWLLFALITTLFWGVWGAFIEAPEKAGFPATLGYSVWALTMIPCSIAAFAFARSAPQRSAKQIAYGSAGGFLGAGGQLLLFEALRSGPAYLVFPIISLYPVLTVLLAYWLLKERASRKAWAGLLLAFPAMALLSWQPPSSSSGALRLWLPLTFGVFVAWGIQAYIMKVSTGLMAEESLFFYMMATAIVLIPAALAMTDFSRPINWGWRGPWLAALIQVLNAMGALSLVYALRHGKAMIVVPMTSLAPVLTVIISLLLYRVIPQPAVVAGLIAASVAIYLMAE